MRTTSLGLFFALTLSLAGVSEARTRATVDGRRFNDVNGSQPAAALLNASANGANATTVLNVGLPAGAVQIDSTYYDLQDMGSMGHHVEVGPDGRVHITWQDDFCELSGVCPPNLNAPQPYPQRGQGYAYRDEVGVWHHIGKVTDPDLAALHCCTAPEEFGGFGSIALSPSGRAVVAQHINEESCDLRGTFYLQDAVNTNNWTAYLPPFSGGASVLFPQVAVTPSNTYSLLGEIPVAGGYDETVQIATSWFPTIGTPYSCFVWQGQDWRYPAPSSLFRDSRPAFPCIAASANGRVGIAVGDFGGNVYLIESSNGSFNPGTITIRNLTNYLDSQIVKTDSTSTQYRPYVHCSLAYQDTTPHVVWSELQARKSGTTVAYYDYRSRIKHWSSTRGVETVYQVPAGVADRFDDVDNLLNGPLAGFNSITVDWPQVGFSQDGSETYVAWLRYTDSEVDPTGIPSGLEGICTGTGYGDIACSAARGAGAWSAMQNLTNTPKVDERFFSMSTINPGGKLRILFQAPATDQAGCALIGDRGAAPGNLVRRIAYFEPRVNASVLDVTPGTTGALRASLSASPNPAFGAARVRFASSLPPAPGRRVEVYSIDGRRVASLPIANALSIEWNGRDASGHAAPAGVYFARLTDDPANSAVRLVLAR